MKFFYFSFSTKNNIPKTSLIQKQCQDKDVECAIAKFQSMYLYIHVYFLFIYFDRINLH